MKTKQALKEAMALYAELTEQETRRDWEAIVAIARMLREDDKKTN